MSEDNHAETADHSSHSPAAVDSTAAPASTNPASEQTEAPATAPEAVAVPHADYIATMASAAQEAGQTAHADTLTTLESHLRNLGAFLDSIPSEVAADIAHIIAKVRSAL